MNKSFRELLKLLAIEVEIEREILEFDPTPVFHWQDDDKKLVLNMTAQQPTHLS
jgi:hypothetical protein